MSDRGIETGYHWTSRISCDGQAEGSSSFFHSPEPAASGHFAGAWRLAYGERSSKRKRGVPERRSLRGYSRGSFHYPVDLAVTVVKPEIGPRWQLTTALTFVF